jgi:hypothetical protein
VTPHGQWEFPIDTDPPKSMYHHSARLNLRSSALGCDEQPSLSPFPVSFTVTDSRIMATHRQARFPSTPYIEPSSGHVDQPKVEEIGTTSAPLKSASFFLGEHCSKYNEDFMLCKNESRDPEHCLKEGRRVTRCAQDL